MAVLVKSIYFTTLVKNCGRAGSPEHSTHACIWHRIKSTQERRSHLLAQHSTAAVHQEDKRKTQTQGGTAVHRKHATPVETNQPGSYGKRPAGDESRAGAPPARCHGGDTPLGEAGATWQNILSQQQLVEDPTLVQSLHERLEPICQRQQS